MKQHFRIIGTGGYLPSIRIASEELDARLGLEAGWTRRHTGVATRFKRGPEETLGTMAVTAIHEALRASGKSLADIDLIIDASMSQQQPIPCNAALIQEALGPDASGIASFDVHGTCLSFLLAAKVVNGLFATGTFKRAIIVSSETPLDGVNWAEPESACLMGDGCGAAILERVENPESQCWFAFETYAEYAHVCEVPAGGHRIPPYSYSLETDAQYRFTMDGPKLHKAASRRMPPMITKLLADSAVPIGEIQIIPHQASGPAVTLLARRLGIQPDRMHNSVEQHGNLVAAGIPYALHKAWDRISPGEWILMIGTAAGYSQGAMLFRR